MKLFDRKQRRRAVWRALQNAHLGAEAPLSYKRRKDAQWRPVRQLRGKKRAMGVK